MSRYILCCSVFLSLFSINAFPAETCIPDGEVQFVCGTTNPEDLYPIPDTPWLIASGRVSDVDGPIYAVNTRDYSVQIVFPEGALAPAHDTVTYRDCPGPNSSGFQPHGLTLREGNAGVHTLYVVGHGEREAIEVFNLDVGGSIPSLQWIGCIIAPEGSRRINSISVLPNGVIAATNFDPAGGELWEWHPTNAWTQVPGSQMRGPNGLVSSADGNWLYIGGWSDRALIRLPAFQGLAGFCNLARQHPLRVVPISRHVLNYAPFVSMSGNPMHRLDTLPAPRTQARNFYDCLQDCLIGWRWHRPGDHGRGRKDSRSRRLQK